jgi:hypothetical protein
MFHAIVRTSNTTDKHPCPRRDSFFFFFACPGFFPFDPFLYCLNPFVFHVTLRSILPSLQQTTQTSMPPVGFEPTIPDPRLRPHDHWDRRCVLTM